jgi:hypothetical protein
VNEPKERVVRRRFLALLLLLVLLGVALFLIAIATISVASPGPALTQITSAPPDPSTSRTATLTYTNVFDVSRFECSLDGSPFAPCGTERPSSITYTELSEGRHAFRVRAVADGVTGAEASHDWTIDLRVPVDEEGQEHGGGSDRPPHSSGSGGDGVDPGEALPPGDDEVPPPPGGSGGGDDGGGGGGGSGDGDTDGGGGGGGQPPSPRGFSITGSTAPADLLYPGGTAATIPLGIRNLRAVAIQVTQLAVEIDGERLPAGCRASWFRITQSNVSSTRRLTVPALGSVTLPAQGVSAPAIRMLDSGNQDACRRATIHLLYAGSARS